MRLRGACALLGVAVALWLLPGTAAATPRDPRLRDVHTWAFGIGDSLAGNLEKRYARYDLLVLDGEEATAGQIRTLHHAGKLVLGYLDVGTIEPYRSWYPLLRPYRMAYWSDWGEWYADVDAPGYRKAMTQQIAPMLLRKGFDGLFLDNTDMIETYSKQTSGMRTLVRALSSLVHRRGGLLFAQNGEDTIGPLLRYYDGWNREDVTGTYDFDRNRYVVQPQDEISEAQQALRWIGSKGLLVLATDYTAAGDRRTAARAIADACAAGALPFVSDIDLTRVPAVAPRCG